MSIRSFLMLLLGMSWWISAGEFGDLSLSIDGNSLAGYEVKNAILYEDVTILYDTTLQLYSGRGFEQYYYPQLHAGSNYVLHLILEDATSTLPFPPFYDLYIDIGDTLIDNLTLPDNGSVYWFKDGNFASQQYQASMQEGTFNLERSEDRAGVEGDFSLEFSFPTPDSFVDRLQRISVSSNLKVPESNLARGGENAVDFGKDRAGALRRNAILAVLAASFIVLLSIR